MKFKILILLLICVAVTFAGDLVTPEVVGSSGADYILVSFTVTDTTVYPQLADADDFYILRHLPNGTLLDSSVLADAHVTRISTGRYEAKFVASSGSITGIYSVYVAIDIGGVWRGHISGGYLVQASSPEAYFVSLMTDTDSLRNEIQLMSYVLATCDGCTKVYTPNDGTAIKDGYQVWQDGSLKVTVTFAHSNVVNALDSIGISKEY